MLKDQGLESKGIKKNQYCKEKSFKQEITKVPILRIILAQMKQLIRW